jgi:hypothetical protein
MARAEYGVGSIRQRGEGRWGLRVFAGRDPATGRSCYLSRSVRGTKKQAVAALAALVTEVGAGAGRRPSPPRRHPRCHSDRGRRQRPPRGGDLAGVSRPFVDDPLANHIRTTGGGDVYLAMTELGTPDADITLVVDVEEHLATRWAAIRAHSSPASPYDELPEALQHEFLATDRLRLVRGVEDLLS